MRIILIISFFYFWFNPAKAQDTLIIKDGRRLIGKVIEINPSSVKMKLQANIDGPAYILNKEDVSRIIYSNGSVENLDLTASSRIKHLKSSRRDTIFGKNFISINTIAHFGKFADLGYERFFKSGYFSVRVPFSFRIRKEPDLYQYSSDEFLRIKNFSTGIGFYGYPAGQGKIKYFAGASLELGTYSYKLWNNYYSPDFTIVTGLIYMAVFQNGILFQPGKHFNISINGDLGYFKTQQKSLYNNGHAIIEYNDIFVRGGINIGCRF